MRGRAVASAGDAAGQARQVGVDAAAQEPERQAEREVLRGHGVGEAAGRGAGQDRRLEIAQRRAAAGVRAR
ncbi:MAG: hypothetical protein H6709_08100 [Kofleriaceae bacterium]|nr:hypothetical protein [Kofleriaceae bacterium]